MMDRPKLGGRLNLVMGKGQKLRRVAKSSFLVEIQGAIAVLESAQRAVLMLFDFTNYLTYP